MLLDIHKMCWLRFLSLLAFLTTSAALPYDPDQVAYNLNQNQSATRPQDYWGEWDNHTYNPSPSNWRFPFYALTLDRFVDGDPTNNEANETLFEHNWMSNQFRFGGDLIGLQNDLDYLQGMGIKGLYLTGSPFINMPWSGDGYGPLDFTLLDHHHGEIQDWRNLISEIHRRDMYVILDNTLATMGDLIAFTEYENASSPFTWDEYDYMWKSERVYHDFQPSSAVNTSCEYPTFYDQSGYPDNFTLGSCRASEFDQYGDMKGVGSYPSWQTQLSKFASVQDRLRAWPGSTVLEKIKIMSCIQIAMFDIDGFRMDKALQTIPDALAEFSSYQRDCARDYAKENFLIVGESVGEIGLTAVFIGRGKSPAQEFTNVTAAMLADGNGTDYLREFGMSALDGQAFHYPTYGAMTRYLGLDGAIGFEGVDFVEHWQSLLETDDMVNANTGEFDPRHMFGMTNQDVFRWPALAMGTERQLLGMFITTLEMPGIPMLLYGEEQNFYILENLAADYVYGRMPMASARAWQLHGCYNLSEEVYVDMPFNSSGTGCHDDSVSLDHRDPSHPFRNIIKRMYEIRQQYPTLNDGYTLQTLSERLYDIYLPGSEGLPSPTGITSAYRGRTAGVQDLSGVGQGNQGAWFVYHNENTTIDYTFDCSGNESQALISAFPANTTVKALFYPYEEYTLESSSFTYGLEGSAEPNGCLSNFTMAPFGYKVFVPKANWSTPAPTITRFVPGHDARLESAVNIDETETVGIEVRFSSEMDCDSVTNSIEINSNAYGGEVAQLNSSSVSCQNVTTDLPAYVGGVATAWIFSAQLINVGNGVHEITVNNASSADGTLTTNARDHFKLRIGQLSNPMVFPVHGNYSYDLLHKNEETGDLYISPMAPGAGKFRYSLNWGSSWSNWTYYTDENSTLVSQPWSGTKLQEWTGEHVMVNYWSNLTGSSDHMQHGDLNRGSAPPRRWPHVFAQGPWNQYGYDGGLPNTVLQDSNGSWKFNLMTEWPNKLVLNVWGMNPDGYPDKTQSLGDVDGDNVLDWLPPSTLSLNMINISKPAFPHLGVQIVANDGNWNFTLKPVGSVWNQLILALILAFVPIISAVAAILLFQKSFYRVKFNEIGAGEKSLWGKTVGAVFVRRRDSTPNPTPAAAAAAAAAATASAEPSGALAGDIGAPSRRTVLVATMEYEIEDWAIKIKIGGLGVMASLMGKNLGHQDLIWVVPCVGDVEYPLDQPGETMHVTILDNTYEIEVQYHVVRNITYVLLDAPIFRKQTKAEPYPARMDDLDSAVYYSAWNTCIAKAIVHFNVDLYHINDYHGALAPLHLLPRTIPICLSLHNAEFQGLWPLRTPDELEEICKVFNLEKSVVVKYVQFGEVFNLLHAGASYLRIHQSGFGAVGVSKKYGKRSFARYPIFWGLKNIGALPNPDPSDTAEWNGTINKEENIVINQEFENERGNLRRQAQEWAGLAVDPDAELFVFVGRWSQQKGVDLIADVFFAVLEENPKVQLICVGPVIDLYGKFAALKLSKMMEKYPTRVFSKPEFTALPPFIFSGAEFALIPSRDEPFGLVAVEFGRKGALGVGSRVGGLGTMPGWWFTIESTTTRHLLEQFKDAIRSAIASSKEVRAVMRHRSALQRFPVAQWVEDLEKLQATSIQIHKQQAYKRVSLLSLRRNSSVPTTELPVNARLSQAPTIIGISSVINTAPNSVPPSIIDAGMETPQTPDFTPVGSPAPSIRPAMPTRQNTMSTLAITEGIEQPFIHASLPSSPSLLSLQAVTGLQASFGLQNVDPNFTDSGGVYYNTFDRMLGAVDGKSSEDKFCIEKYLVQSEKRWFNQRHNAKLGRMSRASTPASSVFRMPGGRTSDPDFVQEPPTPPGEDFLLGDDYKPPSGLRKFFQRKIGDWQLYSFLLAFGQIIAANSYQVTLLTGEIGESAEKLYIIASIYLGASIFWWIVFRRLASIFVLSVPFLFYGLAFFLLGMAPYSNALHGRAWVTNVATGLYAVASASGSFFFALNFGDEGGAPVQSWVLRACMIQGTQQMYVAALWYWGSVQTARASSGVTGSGVLSTPIATAISTPIAVLMWAVGLCLFFGLPKYYRQAPGKVPSFYTSLRRRKIVIWFFVMVILQNYWLSAPFGRNWQYLWSSSHVPGWGMAILAIVFFIGVWALVLWILGTLTLHHSWVLPIFAIGLGFPRWCQMLWGTSNIGLYVPWGGDVIGALLGRSLWCWLGVLDAIQGVGFGMILLQTLTRFHIACALVIAQVVGSLATIAARATSPDKLGPADVFPDFSFGVGDTLSKAPFWVALVCQGVICVGFFAFFRKEQLSKP